MGREHIESCKRNKLPAPEIYPHPDHVDINLNTGEVTIRGPISKADKNVWDMIWDMKATHEDGIKILCDELEKTRPNSRNWRTLNEEIKSCQFQLRFLEEFIWETWKVKEFHPDRAKIKEQIDEKFKPFFDSIANLLDNFCPSMDKKNKKNAASQFRDCSASG